MVAVFTATHWSPTLVRYFRQRSFCYRSNSSIPILIFESDPSIGHSLAAEHRKYVAREFEKYDIIVYHEDGLILLTKPVNFISLIFRSNCQLDILFKNSHLTAYLQETKHLYRAGVLSEFCVGFQRYRRQLRAG